jgi:hypothetical protein
MFKINGSEDKSGSVVQPLNFVNDILANLSHNSIQKQKKKLVVIQLVTKTADTDLLAHDYSLEKQNVNEINKSF